MRLVAGVLIGAVLGGGAAMLFLRWFIALPITLLEPGGSAARSLQESTRRTQGQRRGITRWVAVWLLAQGALAIAIVAVYEFLEDYVLPDPGAPISRILLMTVVILATQALLLELVSLLASLTYAAGVLEALETLPQAPARTGAAS